MLDFLAAAMDELSTMPSLPRRLLVPLMLLLPFIQPLLSVFAQARTALGVHIVAAALSGSDFLLECVKRWLAGTLRSSANVPRSTRERLEFLWRYVVDSVRWLMVCALCVALGFSLGAAVLVVYALYLVLWGRRVSHLALAVRLIAEHLFPWDHRRGRAEGGAADDAAASAGGRASVKRVTSLKSGSHPRCIVMDEGPQFHCASRGCLLGSS